MNLLTRLRRIVRFNYLKVLRLQSSAHSIALGCALGLFVGFLPIIPFQAPTVLLLAFVFRASKIAAFLCTFISSPVNLLPFYYMLYQVGVFLLPFEHVPFVMKDVTLMSLLHTGWKLVVIMTCGGLLLGIPSSILMYFVSLRAILTFRKQRALRLLRKRSHN